MNTLNGDMILTKVVEYHYYHEAGSKVELILCCVRDITTIYKKEIRILINSINININININEINRIDIVVGDDHGQREISFFNENIVYNEYWQDP